MLKYLIPILIVACGAMFGLKTLQKNSSQEKLRVGGEQTEGSSVSDFRPHTVIPTPFKTLKQAPMETADQASDLVKDSDLVLGVTVNGESSAYPITMLCGPTREIINTELGGSKIAATW